MPSFAGAFNRQSEMHALEGRTYFAAPVLDTVPLQTVPLAKTIQVPLTATDADGHALQYTVTSDNPNVTVSLHPSTNTWLQLSTTQGVMTFQLFNDIAPDTVATMTGLVDSGYFNGLKFYRISSSPRSIYTGSPTNDTTGGPGFRFDDEFNPDAIFANPGVLAMLNAGKDNNGSQFFITDAPFRDADFNNTIWGQLVRGQSALNHFFTVETTPQGAPLVMQKIKSAAIVTDTSDAVLEVKGASLGGAKITIKCDDGVGGSATQDFTVNVQPDVVNGLPYIDPPILSPVSDFTAPKSKPISFTIGTLDDDAGPVDYAATLVGDASQLLAPGSAVKVTGNLVTLTPRRTFTGPLKLFVGAAAPGATRRGYVQNPYDTQQIQIGVGDLPASGSGVTFDALAGMPTGKISLGTFRDSDPTGTAANWNAIATSDPLGKVGGVNWGDDTIDDGSIVQTHTGSLSVVGSHVYPAAGTYPVTVVVQGDLGAEVTLQGSAVVRDLASIAGSTLTLNGTSGNDVIGISGNGGIFSVTMNGVTKQYSAAGITRVEIYAQDGNDRVSIGAGVPGTYVDAGAGNDSVDGGDGNDTLTGGAGKNTLNGNAGNDRLNGSGGRDLLNGGEGNDFLYGNGGDDTLDGGSGTDHLFAGDGNDLLVGGGGNDKLYGQGGNDTLIGGKGVDVEDGGDGVDSAQQDGTDVLAAIENVV